MGRPDCVSRGSFLHSPRRLWAEFGPQALALWPRLRLMTQKCRLGPSLTHQPEPSPPFLPTGTGSECEGRVPTPEAPRPQTSPAVPLPGQAQARARETPGPTSSGGSSRIFSPRAGPAGSTRRPGRPGRPCSFWRCSPGAGRTRNESRRRSFGCRWPCLAGLLRQDKGTRPWTCYFPCGLRPPRARGPLSACQVRVVGAEPGGAPGAWRNRRPAWLSPERLMGALGAAVARDREWGLRKGGKEQGTARSGQCPRGPRSVCTSEQEVGVVPRRDKQGPPGLRQAVGPGELKGADDVKMGHVQQVHGARPGEGQHLGAEGTHGHVPASPLPARSPEQGRDRKTGSARVLSGTRPPARPGRRLRHPTAGSARAGALSFYLRTPRPV